MGCGEWWDGRCCEIIDLILIIFKKCNREVEFILDSCEIGHIEDNSKDVLAFDKRFIKERENSRMTREGKDGVDI